MSNDIVPIGKYKGQPLERLMADQSYTEWLLAQAWFIDRYADLAQLLRMGRLIEPQDSPEHNAMVAGLIDRQHEVEWLFSHVMPGSMPIEDLYLAKMYQEIEPKGGDLMVRFYGTTILIEAKPLIGDDYPSVIRQIKAGCASASARGVVIARKVEPTNLNLAQVRRQFQLAGVHLVLEQEFFDAARPWSEARKSYLETELARTEVEIADAERELPEVEAAIVKDNEANGWPSYELKTKLDYLAADISNRKLRRERLQRAIGESLP